MKAVYDSEVRTSVIASVRKNLQEFWTYRFALKNFVASELEQRYRRSIIGFFWTLLNPLLTMAITATVFSLIWRMNIRSFAVYIFSGIVPFTFISAAITRSGISIIAAEDYLKKIYVPKFLFPLVTVTSETVNFVFSLVALFILGVLLKMHVGWAIVLLPAAIGLTFLFSLGIGLILSVATVYVRDLSHITSVLLSALFYLVPIIYPIDFIPEAYRGYFWYNPFFYFINLFRRLIYENVFPSAFEWIVPLGLSLCVVVIGQVVLFLKEGDLIYRL
jgi:ABC-type polysaccharide/polyol phosphate export permease